MRLSREICNEYVRVRLPIRIVSESNRRDHWAVAHRRHKRQRADTLLGMQWAARSVRARGIGRIHLAYHGPRRMDDGNIAAALKHVQDGVADALGIDDGKLRWSYESVGGAKQPAVIVTIYWEEQGYAADNG